MHAEGVSTIFLIESDYVRMAYCVSLMLVIGFIANVTVGAFAGSAPLDNVAEMLILLVASIAFSVGILQSEATARSSEAADKLSL